jgi:hypothetical protein
VTKDFPRPRVRARGTRSVRPQVPRDEVGVFAQPVRVALDGDDHRVVQQPVEQRGGDHGVAEDLGPLAEAAVAGQDHRAALVAGVDELEEQVAAAGAHRQVAELV